MFRFCCFILLLSSSLIAETLGDIDFNLPTNAKDWMKLNLAIQLKGAQAEAFMPAGQKPASLEMFVAYVTPKEVDLKDKNALEEGLRSIYPSKKVSVKILEEDKQSVILEWSILDLDKLTYGLGRIFSAPHETIFLFYQTENKETMDTARDTWLPVLRQAKLLPKK